MQNIVNNVYLCRMNLSINHQKAGITVRLALVTLMFSLASATASAQQVTISNNLLYDLGLPVTMWTVNGNTCWCLRVSVIGRIR